MLERGKIFIFVIASRVMNKDKRKRALVIVAHPDDETIWMGGMILRNKDWDWTICSLCRAADLDRAPKFRKVCFGYGARAIISDLDDEVLEDLEIDEVVDKIKENVDGKYDYVFTHGENGEYGHIRHKETHKAVKRMFGEGELQCENVFFFSYEMKDGKKIPDSRGADFGISLTKSELEQKRKIIKDVYGFTSESFEYLSSGGKENFTRV